MLLSPAFISQPELEFLCIVLLTRPLQKRETVRLWKDWKGPM